MQLAVAPQIVWVEKPKESWSYQAGDRTLQHQYTIEHVPVSQLRLHEEPSRYRVSKMVKAMLAGEPQELPEADENGLVMDGHARIVSAVRILGNEATIPVHRHRLVELEATPQARRPEPGPG